MHIQPAYGDWRDKINPELLRRYWRRKGSPGIFLHHTPYGFTFCIKDISGGAELLLLYNSEKVCLTELNW